MRHQGRVSEWNDDRGFGFVAPNGGGARVFLHVSAFAYRQRRPTVGKLVTYELTTDERGRPQARNARFVEQPEAIQPRVGGFFVSVLIALGILVPAGYVAYVRISHPNSTISASLYKILSARDALRSHPAFQCAPEKSSCSKMSSCAEAFFHQERCGVANMDGDRDGIPCEQQLCK
jgi:cold shock CspA family protein